MFSPLSCWIKYVTPLFVSGGWDSEVPHLKSSWILMLSQDACHWSWVKTMSFFWARLSCSNLAAESFMPWEEKTMNWWLNKGNRPHSIAFFWLPFNYIFLTCGLNVGWGTSCISCNKVWELYMCGDRSLVLFPLTFPKASIQVKLGSSRRDTNSTVT